MMFSDQYRSQHNVLSAAQKLLLTLSFVMLIAPETQAQSALDYKPDQSTFSSEWILGWVFPSNSTKCHLSGGKSTVSKYL